MDLRKTEITQKTLIVILFITTLIITFCGYKQEMEIIALEQENEKLTKNIEIQQLVITELEKSK